MFAFILFSALAALLDMLATSDGASFVNGTGVDINGGETMA